MFAWEIGLKTNFQKSIGKSGKYLQKYLAPEVWQEFEHYTE
jgi:aminoglycoside 6-adenylyltransferase